MGIKGFREGVFGPNWVPWGPVAKMGILGRLSMGLRGGTTAPRPLEEKSLILSEGRCQILCHRRASPDLSRGSGEEACWFLADFGTCQEGRVMKKRVNPRGFTVRVFGTSRFWPEPGPKLA